MGWQRLVLLLVAAALVAGVNSSDFDDDEMDVPASATGDMQMSLNIEVCFIPLTHMCD